MHVRTRGNQQVDATGRMAMLGMLMAAGCWSAPQSESGAANPSLLPPSSEEVGQSASQSVGAAGGAVGTRSQSAFAAVPPGALASQVELSVQVSNGEGMPLQGNLLTNVYDFGPSDTTFLKPVILTLAIATGPTLDQQPMIAYLDANQIWQALLDSTYNVSTGAVTATTTHFTPFSVVAYGVDGAGCAQQRDPVAFCNPGQLICNMKQNACGSATFTIGGSVSGLDGAVSLRDNVGDVVVVTANSNFTFPTAYGVGDGYVITIADAPRDQNCMVEGASGIVIDSDVNAILVQCFDKTPTTYTIVRPVLKAQPAPFSLPLVAQVESERTQRVPRIDSPRPRVVTTCGRTLLGGFSGPRLLATTAA